MLAVTEQLLSVGVSSSVRDGIVAQSQCDLSDFPSSSSNMDPSLTGPSSNRLTCLRTFAVPWNNCLMLSKNCGFSKFSESDNFLHSGKKWMQSFVHFPQQFPAVRLRYGLQKMDVAFRFETWTCQNSSLFSQGRQVVIYVKMTLGSLREEEVLIYYPLVIHKSLVNEPQVPQSYPSFTRQFQTIPMMKILCDVMVPMSIYFRF